MSNDMIIHQSAAPAYLAKRDPSELAELNRQAATGTIGKSINRISLKQSRFRLIKGGREVAVIPDSKVELVFLLCNPALTKTFFEKAYNPGQEPEAPDCYSEDGVRPAADAKKRQADTCAVCPHNQWGSKINPHTGKEGKACADSKRVAVVPPSRIDGEAFQLPIPAASMGDFGSYMSRLSEAQPPVPYNAVVTQVSFDTSADYPKLLFTATRYLSAEEYNAVDPRRKESEVKLVAGLPGMGFSANAQAATEAEAQGSTQAKQPEPESKPEPQAKQSKPEPQAKQPEPEPQAAEDPWGAAQAQPSAQAKPEPQAKQQTQQAAQQTQSQAEVADGWGAAQETVKKDPAPSPAAEVDSLGEDLDGLLAGWDPVN